MLDPLKLADEIEASRALILMHPVDPPCVKTGLSAEAHMLIVRALRELGAKPVEVTGDVRERVARAIVAATVGDTRPLHTILSESAILRLATAALRALRPGDVVPGGVVVPAEQAEQGRRILDGIDQWVRAELETPHD